MSTQTHAGTGVWFRLAVLLKGADGVLQVLTAFLLLVVPPSVITGVANAVITRDLVGDHDGTLAHHLSRAAQDFADGGGTRTFAIVFLLLHGLVKIGLVTALLKRIRPMYPVAAVVLGLFVGYEVYRAIRTGSIGLPVFAAIDVVIIVMIVREYRRLPVGGLSG
ncbi:DUF2127 domain-containing protein [Actinokineospora sp. NBRC 105648]|uniref:DUF2127 domain-containing protein n=1 Tax=Actinokineospora sp. NBRC 105648 TaxID=3032206 RepID=UPI0024A165E9|nr:DUF2127 domain-containing protein [Actinokineospora sp. NBRC 105648]GLZ41617.1 hypothetical protein Acsp05_52410 [Actinokineospora sp. NBRC 105648]